MLQRFVFGVLALILAAAIGVAVVDWGKAPPPEHGGETDDRRRDPAIEKLLAEPLKAADTKRWDQAAKGFEAALAEMRRRHGANSLQAADTLSAYGVGLFTADHKAEALPYLTRAVAAYRAAAGPDSPEVAVALHDFVNVSLDIAPDRAPPELVAAAREALRIREKALGPKNAETAVTYVLLGRLTGMPENTQGDPAKLEAAATLIRRGMALLPLTPNADPSDLGHAHFRLAEIYARNGRAVETLDLVGRYTGDDEMDSDRKQALALKLQATGQSDAARIMRERYIGRPDPQDEPEAPPTIKNAGKLNTY